MSAAAAPNFKCAALGQPQQDISNVWSFHTDILLSLSWSFSVDAAPLSSYAMRSRIASQRANVVGKPSVVNIVVPVGFVCCVRALNVDVARVTGTFDRLTNVDTFAKIHG